MSFYFAIVAVTRTRTNRYLCSSASTSTGALFASRIKNNRDIKSHASTSPLTHPTSKGSNYSRLLTGRDPTRGPSRAGSGGLTDRVGSGGVQISRVRLGHVEPGNTDPIRPTSDLTREIPCNYLTASFWSWFKTHNKRSETWHMHVPYRVPLKRGSPH